MGVRGNPPRQVHSIQIAVMAVIIPPRAFILNGTVIVTPDIVVSIFCGKFHAIVKYHAVTLNKSNIRSVKLFFISEMFFF